MSNCKRTIHVNVSTSSAGPFCAIWFIREFPCRGIVCNSYYAYTPERMKLAGRIFLKTLKDALNEMENQHV